MCEVSDFKTEIVLTDTDCQPIQSQVESDDACPSRNSLDLDALNDALLNELVEAVMKSNVFVSATAEDAELSTAKRRKTFVRSNYSLVMPVQYAVDSTGHTAVYRVSPRKYAKPGGRLEGRPTGSKACFCDRGLTQASN